MTSHEILELAPRIHLVAPKVSRLDPAPKPSRGSNVKVVAMVATVRGLCFATAVAPADRENWLLYRRRAAVRIAMARLQRTPEVMVMATGTGRQRPSG